MGAPTRMRYIHSVCVCEYIYTYDVKKGMYIIYIYTYVFYMYVCINVNIRIQTYTHIFINMPLCAVAAESVGSTIPSLCKIWEIACSSVGVSSLSV